MDSAHIPEQHRALNGRRWAPHGGRDARSRDRWSGQDRGQTARVLARLPIDQGRQLLGELRQKGKIGAPGGLNTKGLYVVIEPLPRNIFPADEQLASVDGPPSG
jgi:hypothetical protein